MFSLVASVLACVLFQDPPKSFPKVDPYTKSAPAKVKAAGYVSLGPFRFGDDHTTDQVDRAFKGVPLIWIETAHFKLGSGLGPSPMPKDKKEKKRLMAEIERLGKRVPDVKPKLRELDPWLRLHLTAQRLEDAYAEFLERFGLAESDFPTNAMDVDGPTGTYMGEGPYLGMSAKFAVLVFQREQDLERYAKLHLDGASGTPLQAEFSITGALFLGLAADALTGEYASEVALACALADGIVRNFVRGFRAHRVPVPFVFEEAVGHWFARRIDPRYHFFQGSDPAKNRITDDWDWAAGVRERVEKKSFRSTAELLGLSDQSPLDWSDHMVLWSRLDFLFAQESAGAALRHLKEPLPELRDHPSPEALAEPARAAFAAGAGLELDAFDAAWAAWVPLNYQAR